MTPRIHETGLLCVSHLDESLTATARGGFVKAECSKQKLLFEGHGTREVVAAFDGGKITSNAGGLLLREVEEPFRILRPFVDSFTDHRSPDAIEFTVEELLRQRVMDIALGWDDPCEAAEDWWPNFGERGADLHRFVGIVSVPASVRTRSGEHSSITDTAADARSRRGVSGVLRTITKIRERIVEHSRRCDTNAGQLPQQPEKKHAAPRVPAVSDMRVSLDANMIRA